MVSGSPGCQDGVRIVAASKTPQPTIRGGRIVVAAGTIMRLIFKVLTLKPTFGKRGALLSALLIWEGIGAVSTIALAILGLSSRVAPVWFDTLRLLTAYAKLPVLGGVWLARRQAVLAMLVLLGLQMIATTAVALLQKTQLVEWWSFIIFAGYSSLWLWAVVRKWHTFG